LSKLNEAFWAGLRARETVTIYEPMEKRFYRYNWTNGLYEPISDDKLRTEFGQRIYEASLSWGKEWYSLQRFRTAPNLNAIIAHFRGQTEIADPFQKRPWIIHCANGVLEFSTNHDFSLQSFSPKYWSRYASPLSYEPTAIAPRFQSALFSHLGADDIVALQKAGGQALLGHNLIQRIFILDGIGGSSKGAFLEVTKLTVGLENCGELRTQHLGERFEIARISNRSLLFGSDVPGNFLLVPSATFLKSMVGGDTLDREIKGSMNGESIRGQFNILISANCRLRLRLDSDYAAWQRRLVDIHYEKPYIGQTVPEIAQLLFREEGSGILNWFVRGAQALLADIEQFGDIQLSQAQKERIEKLLRESDSLRLFLLAKVKKEPKSDLTTDEIFAAYLTYCSTCGIDNLSRSLVDRRLVDLMSELFQSQKSTNIYRIGKTRRGYLDVDFIP